MAKQKKQEAEAGELIGLLKDLLIANLAIAGVGQAEIREIVQCDIYKVSRIAKHLKRKTK